MGLIDTYGDSKIIHRERETNNKQGERLRSNVEKYIHYLWINLNSI